MLPILLSIPHGGTAVPAELRESVCLTPQDQFDDGDPFTREIFDVGAAVAHVLKADIARSYVDLNRDPADRPPANPDGVVKTSTCYGRRIYKPGSEPTPELTEILLQRYYRPYHAALERAAARAGVAIGLDCHSMAATAPAIAPDPGRKRPAFCLSNREGATCPTSVLEKLARAISRAFGLNAGDVALNEPFKGGYITQAHGNRPVPWVQVELNRSFYLDSPWHDRETLTVDPDRLAELRQRFLAALAELDP